MKVMNIFPAAKIGGVPSVVLDFIKNTKEVDSIVVTHAADKSLFEEFKKYAYKTYDVYTLGVSLTSIFKIVGIVRRHKPDIIHIHGKGGAFYGLCVCLILLKPCKVVYTLHGYNNRFEGAKRFLYRYFERVFSYFVDRYIAVSESEKRHFMEEQNVSIGKISIIFNGVEEVSRKELPHEKATLLSKFQCNIVTLSRLSPQKDIETMLLSHAELVKKLGGSVALHILGGNLGSEQQYANQILSLSDMLNLKDNVFFWGEVESARDYLHCFDVYLSTALWEGLPTAIIEAMLNRVPVVGTNCRGNVDLIEHRVTGYLAKQQNPEDVCLKIMQCLGDIHRPTIIDNAYRFAKENCSLQKYVSNLEEVYNYVLEGR